MKIVKKPTNYQDAQIEYLPEPTPSMDRYFEDFHIAGFVYYDGVEVFNELKIGTELTLIVEPQNKYDIFAVAIYYQNHKLGYIPRSHNKYISKFLNLGHKDIFEVKINRISPEENPENQIGVVIKIVDKTT